mmetsp:Transcript_29011/g.52483  ORF Transcript_29011/g.52483 Transcript_29011/m.52483 type:complete len:171 (+) Transcript_29011:867-1379(+)
MSKEMLTRFYKLFWTLSASMPANAASSFAACREWLFGPLLHLERMLHVAKRMARAVSYRFFFTCSRIVPSNINVIRHRYYQAAIQGTLRSILICDECGRKRNTVYPKLFTLSKQVQDGNAAGFRGSKVKLSLERCLGHFTSPESIADRVDCPQCMKTTPTKKQHTFAKLP